MKNLAIDQNSRTCVFAPLGFGKNFKAGDAIPPSVTGIVRIANVDANASVIRYKADKDSDGVVIAADDVLWTEISEEIEVVSGEVNIMF